MEALILSYALDTNGQNSRFVKAAEKWGQDDGVLEALAIGKDDPAGVVGRLQAAADKYGGLRIRSAHRAIQYFQFPHDLIWNKKNEPEIRKLAEEADVIHLNNSYTAAHRFRIRKPMLLHHHGTLFRNNPKHMLDVARHGRMLQAVSTIDLQKPDPKVLHWLPTAYDVDELAVFAQQHRREPDGRIRIVHAPTNRMLKDTDLLIRTVRAMQADGLPVDLDLVERKTWAETMERKAKADIVFDQLVFGYGCNSVEAWAMNIPVVSGADEWTLLQMSKEWGGLPFVPATDKTLDATLRRMVMSAEMRQEATEFGHAHVRRFHDERPALERLAELYAKAVRFHHRIRIPGKGERAVTFRRLPHGRMNPRDLDGVVIPFVKGECKTSDPYVINRLRTLSKRAVFGIVEVA